MRDFPYPMDNRFPVSTFVSVGDDVVWSNALPPEVEKAMKEAGTYIPRENFKGVAVEVHEDHAIVAYRAKPDRKGLIKRVKKPVSNPVEFEYEEYRIPDPIPDGELMRVGDPRKDYWFTRTPTSIFYDVLGMPEINAGKLRDLLDFGDSDIELWNYLADLTRGHRHLADEVVNFILGPLAAALKVKSSDPTKGGTIYGFRDREKIVPQYAVEVMFEAVALGLVPKSIRKELDAFMVGEFGEILLGISIDNVDADSRAALLDTFPLIATDDRYAILYEKQMDIAFDRFVRVVFYEKLSELLEVVLAAADVDIGAMVDKVFADNPAQAEKAKSDPKLIGWAMGQVMKASPTKLDPNEVRAVIVEKLK